jgi:hypothetical protein
MIAPPINDHDCLSKITDEVQAKVSAPDVQAIAARFATTAALAHWIRTLPHQPNNDEEPSVQCDVPQRLRVPSPVPNCVERSALYMAAAETIDPRPVRQLATLSWRSVEDGSAGELVRHTLPVENGHAVILDSLVRTDVVDGGLYRLARDAGHPDELTFAEALHWSVDIVAGHVSGYRDGDARVANGRAAVAALIAGGAMDELALRDLLWCLALARRIAVAWGPDRVALIDTLVATEIRGRLRAAPRDRIRISLAPLSDVAKVTGQVVTRVGPSLVSIGLKTLLASYGVPPTVVDQVEHEVSRAAADRYDRPARREGEAA